MTKPKKTHENQPPELLAPVSVTQTESEKAKELIIEVPPGHVYIVGLNPDGTKKEGSGFFYPERSYQRIYGDKTKYSVKKKSTLTILNNHHYETLYRSSQQITFSAHRRCNSCGG